MNVVADTNVVISAIFWPGESRRCLALWAKRRFHLALTVPVFEEYGEIARRIAVKIPEVNPEPWLNWIERNAKVYEQRPWANNAAGIETMTHFWRALWRARRRLLSRKTATCSSWRNRSALRF